MFPTKKHYLYGLSVWHIDNQSFEAHLEEHLQIFSAAKYKSVGNVSMHVPLQLQAVNGCEGVTRVADFCGLAKDACNSPFLLDGLLGSG